MAKLIELTGQRFGRLTVLERAGSTKQGHPLWLCRCDCGNTSVVRSHLLRHGLSRSCGCLNREEARKRRLEWVCPYGTKEEGPFAMLYQLHYIDNLTGPQIAEHAARAAGWTTVPSSVVVRRWFRDAGLKMRDRSEAKRKSIELGRSDVKERGKVGSQVGYAALLERANLPENKRRMSKMARKSLKIARREWTKICAAKRVVKLCSYSGCTNGPDGGPAFVERTASQAALSKSGRLYCCVSHACKEINFRRRCTRLGLEIDDGDNTLVHLQRKNETPWDVPVEEAPAIMFPSRAELPVGPVSRACTSQET